MSARHFALLLVVAAAPLAPAQTLMVPADGVKLANQDKADKEKLEREEEEKQAEAKKEKKEPPPPAKYEYAKYDPAAYAKFDDTKAYPTPPGGSLPAVWVPQAELAYRAEPGENAAALFRKSAFMEPRSAWAIAVVNGVEYVLVTEVDGNNLKPKGWVRRDQLIYDDLSALKMPGKDGKPTAIHRKAMIVNSRRSVQEFDKNPKFTLFDLEPTAEVAAALKGGKLPAAVWDGFRKNEVVPADDPKAEVRPRGKEGEWAVSFVTRGRPPAVNGDRHYYDVLTESPGKLVVREGLNMAWAYDRPQVGRKYRTKSFAVASPLFIYQFQTTADESGWKKTFALVGSSPRLNDRADGAKEIHGWLELDRLAEWNTAEALEWNRDTTLPDATGPKRAPDGALFCGVWNPQAAAEEPPGDAVAKRFWDLKAGVVGEQDANTLAAKKKSVEEYITTHFLAMEEKEKAVGKGPVEVSRTLRGQEMRYPLLDADDYEKDGRKTRLYKLGWMGPLVAIGQKDLDPAAFAKIVQDLMALRGDFQTIELVFVIDGTGGNTEARQAVAPRVVDEWLGGLEEAQATVPGLRVRASVVMFGVKKDGSLDLAETDKGDAEVIAPVPGRTAAVKAVTAARREKLKALLGRNDMLKEVTSVEEPVFDALQYAIGRTPFLPQSQKFVVFIGDMGDVSKGEPAEGIKTLVEKLQGKEKEADRGGKQPINFVAIQLKTKGGNAAGEKFLTDQLKDLKAYAEERVKKVVNGKEEDLPRLDGAKVSVFEASDAKGAVADAVKAQLAKVLTDIKQTSQEVDDEARRMMEGTLRQPESQALQRFFRYNPNVDLSFLKNGYVQVYQVGYAFQDVLLPDGTQVPQLKPVYLVPRADVEKLRDFLKKLTPEGLVKDQDGDALKKALLGAMEVVTSEKDLTPAEWGRTLAGIEFKSALLEKDPSDVKKLKVDQAEMDRLYVVARRLDDLLKETSMERNWRVTITQDGQQRKFRSVVGDKNGTRVDRSYKFPGDSTEWLWLDKEKDIP